MKASNTARAYGGVARLFHWTIALLILAAIGLGLYAGSLPRGSQEAMQAIFQTFSIHKTIGVAALILAVLRILWTLTQTHPRPLHPNRAVETFLAGVVHWGMWIGMVIIPLSGWLLHSAAPGGFSRILWPLGQRLPGVPQDAALAERFASFHEAGWWLLAGLVVLHVAGALKHALIDRDGTLHRMAGSPDKAPVPPAAGPSHALRHVVAAVLGLGLWVAVAVISVIAPEEEAKAPPAATTVQTAPQTAAVTTGTAPAWAVQQGELAIQVQQGQSPVKGRFGKWQATISYDPETRSGHVEATADIASLELGSVADTAKGPDFLNAAAHPSATFSADILPPATEGGPETLKGTMTIAGKAMPLEFPATITTEGDTATARGQFRLDRRDYGVGASYADEGTVGFGVEVTLDLTAKRQ
ncbi:cytochrome B [Paracoccus limosus]|uniref:Cytochrome B n=1 Tax=Paracoccus limosus TaxID=913252 RepID=A0A844H8Y8_9RHOB|nr:cytochrome b/b6 domain-containing protein [Paracoccus limosus]MTH36354.1 cytochrome B [Paracoccus limosus]